MIDEVVFLLMEELKRLRTVMKKMKASLDAPEDERLRVLALAHYEQLHRKIK